MAKRFISKEVQQANDQRVMVEQIRLEGGVSGTGENKCQCEVKKGRGMITGSEVNTNELDPESQTQMPSEARKVNR